MDDKPHPILCINCKKSIEFVFIDYKKTGTWDDSWSSMGIPSTGWEREEHCCPVPSVSPPRYRAALVEEIGVDRLRNLFSVWSDQSVLLVGPPGSGKTFCLSALINSLSDRGISCDYRTEYELSELYRARFGGSKELVELKYCAVLAIDELASCQALQAGAVDAITDLINYRYNHGLPTLFAMDKKSSIAKKYSESLEYRIISQVESNKFMLSRKGAWEGVENV